MGEVFNPRLFEGVARADRKNSGEVAGVSGFKEMSSEGLQSDLGNQDPSTAD
jgi:hypothetical protein